MSCSASSLLAKITVGICNIFKGKNLGVNSLILTLAALDNGNITIFSTDEALKRIHSVDELFIHISHYCSVYDYELLTDLVQSTECSEAMELLDGFTQKLNSSILSDLDLLCEDGELQDPKVFMPGTHKLAIKYVGGECTMKIEKLVRSIICECLHLRKGSIFFIGVQMGSVNFIYQISAAIKAHIQQYPMTAKNVFSDKIKCLIIDDEEVKFPVQCIQLLKICIIILTMHYGMFQSTEKLYTHFIYSYNFDNGFSSNLFGK